MDKLVPEHVLVQTWSGVRVRATSTWEDWEKRRKSRLLPLKEAWEGTHDSDLMISRYTVMQDGAEIPAPRLKKRSEVYNTLSEHGKSAACSILIGDLDEPGLKKSEFMTQAFMEEKKAIIDRYAEEMQVYSVCTTRGGFHLLWVFDAPVTPEHSEAIYKALRKQLRPLGLLLDAACKDWTRLIRAPKVLREGEEEFATYMEGAPLKKVYRTEDMPHFMLHNYGHVYTPQGVVAPPPPPTECIQHDAPPEPAELDQEWKEKALTIVRNSSTYDIQRQGLLEGELVFGAGLKVKSRHNEMKNTLAWLVGLLNRASLVLCPEQLYAWLYSKAEACQRPGDERSQTYELWRLCEWVCHAQQEADAALEAEASAIGEEALTRVALVKDGYYILKKNGTYSSAPAAKDALFNELRHLDMNTHAPINVIDDQGRAKDLNKVTWLNRHSLTLHRLIYGTHEDGAHYTCIDGVRILKVPLYTRTKLKPKKPTPEIEEWLDLIEKEVTNGSSFRLHLAHMPSYWQAPCAAMGLLWPTGCGKSLLLDAIRQLVHEGSLGGASCYGGFQDHLLKTPYLLVDEGFSRAHNQHGISDRFKEYATGGALIVNPKGKPEVSISPVYPRQVFCCESQELFSSLLTSSDKSDASMDATYARIRMYETSSTAIGEYLQRIGGEKVTRSWTNPKNPLLTRAILWLAQEAKAQGTLHDRGLRFGVPEVKDKVLDRIMLTTPESDIIDHALALLVKADRDEYWLEEREAFFFKAEEVLEFIKSSGFLRLYLQCRTWTLKEVRRELRKRGPNVQRRGGKGFLRARGYQVDPIMITFEVPETQKNLGKDLGYDAN